MIVGPRNRPQASNKKWQNIIIGLAAFIVITPLMNYVLMTKSLSSSSGNAELMAKNAELEERLRGLEEAVAWPSKERSSSGHDDNNNNNNDPPLSSSSSSSSGSSSLSSSSSSSNPLLVKANSINSYWWPSAEEGGGVLGTIHAAQNPADCSSPRTKFLVWRSRPRNEKDTRGLTAWAHAGSSHLMHALTDGDRVDKTAGTGGSRVLIADDKVWPMAKGCADGPETRECYFEPLTSCSLSHVDAMNAPTSAVLKEPKEEYDRSLRTIYSSDSIWFRIVRDKYSWTVLPGDGRDHSAITVLAASLAYYFRPKPWLMQQIDERIRESVPRDLNPDRTVGVPIRRSDKCHGHNVTGSAMGELECPPLSSYLDGLRTFMRFDPLIENVIVTSEDRSACDEFLALLGREEPSLRVVLNVGDVQQGTGSGSKLEAYVDDAANAKVVASALTSMHLHLRARYLIVTTKSTWTSTIAVMARAYGFASGIFVMDIGRNTNAFSDYARSGCFESRGRAT